MLTTLLAPLDRSAIAEQAIGPAAAIARACHGTVDLVVVTRPDEQSVFSDEPAVVEAQLQNALYVRQLARDLEGAAFIRTTHAALRGEIVASIVSRAHDIRADLIVMTSHGRTGLSRAWLGSVADGVIRSARTPVLMLRPTASPSSPFAAQRLYQRILVPLDGSVESRGVLRTATELARCGGARIVLLRIVRPAPMLGADASLALLYPALLRDEVATASRVDKAQLELRDVEHGLEQDGVDAEHHVVVAEHVAPAILDFSASHGIDLIAMSTVGRGTSRLVIGSLADKIVRGSELPVLFYTPEHALSRTLLDVIREEEMSPAIPH